ncbi:retrotransposon protein, putative, ty1-copia subclass [Tanacetum coccineum]|uniref:Retrotransposon protein, putative, ty1-copia subclass n=1 Tax=Tanacetum coccineum TaxID=301880 RepID=A0ABQ5A4H3_9ASTR
MDGKVHTYKARLVANGYTQTHGIDYEETFSPVAKIKSIRIILAIAAFHDYEIWQMDVKTAFLNGKLTEDVFLAQPKGFENAKPDVSFASSMVSRHQKNPGEGHWTAVKNILNGDMESSKQDTMADSTCKSEYIAPCEASKEAIRMKNFIGDLGVVSTIQDPIEIFCDNKSAVTLTKEPKDHRKVMILKEYHHFVRCKEEEGHADCEIIR